MAPGLTFTKAYASQLNNFKEAFKNHSTALAIVMIPGVFISEAVKLTALAVDLLKDTILTTLSLVATVLTLGFVDKAKKSLAFHGEGLAQDLVVLFASILDPITMLLEEVKHFQTIGRAMRNAGAGN